MMLHKRCYRHYSWKRSIFKIFMPTYLKRGNSSTIGSTSHSAIVFFFSLSRGRE